MKQDEYQTPEEFNQSDDMAVFSKKLADTIFETEIDLTLDILQKPFDALASGTVLENVPIIKSIYAGVKNVIAIREWAFAKKLVHFLYEFSHGQFDEEKIHRHKERLRKPKYRDKVMEHVSTMLDKLISTYKARILARLYVAYINRHLEWVEFVDLSQCLDQLNTGAIQFLRELGSTNRWQSPRTRRNEEHLLIACGIAFTQNEPYSVIGEFFMVNDLGRKLYIHGIANATLDVEDNDEPEGAYLEDH
ncbi:hypothetical protein [Effusibacillus pohliae]|uniref:hypothetical protein n=1 Tax=Effusibacillus pohliae TaxID=232270 RepID=UPI0003791F4A|nr:hypothetical protein [Effusibacillus pohliae]